MIPRIRFSHLASLSAALLTVLCAADASAQAKVSAVGSDGKPRFFDTQFHRYGYALGIAGDAKGVRFRLPFVKGGVEQTGLYSYFALAGNFEVDATFKIDSLPTSKKGYGASISVSVDTDGPDGNVFISRINRSGVGHGFVVTRAERVDKEMKYNELKHHASKATIGRMVLRREGADVICLVAEGPKGELREIERVPFTKKTVRKVRLFVDGGGIATPIDAQVTRLQVRADEITGGIPESDRGGGWGWWLVLVAVVAAGGGYYMWRRWQEEEED